MLYLLHKASPKGHNYEVYAIGKSGTFATRTLSRAHTEMRFMQEEIGFEHGRLLPLAQVHSRIAEINQDRANSGFEGSFAVLTEERTWDGVKREYYRVVFKK